MCTCIYDSYNLPEGLFGSYVVRLGTKFNSSQPGLVENLTLILDDSLAKYYCVEYRNAH